MAVYRPTYFPGNLLSYLPSQVGPCKVSYLLDSELDLVPGVIEKAARAGLNVGVDEFTEEWYEWLIDGTNVFTIRSDQSEEEEEIKGIILIHNNLYCRSLHPVEGYFEIILDPSLLKTDKDVYGSWVEFCVRAAQDIFPYYLGVSTSLFTVHAQWIAELRRQNFELTACIPFAGNLSKTKQVDSYILHKKYENAPDCNAKEIVSNHNRPNY